jgi:hypothetical protein
MEINAEWRARFAPHAPTWAIVMYLTLREAAEQADRQRDAKSYRRLSEAASRALYALEWVWCEHDAQKLAEKFFSDIVSALIN